MTLKWTKFINDCEEPLYQPMDENTEWLNGVINELEKTHPTIPKTTFSVNLSAEDVFKLSEIVSSCDPEHTKSIRKALEHAEIDAAYEDYSNDVPIEHRMSKDEFTIEYQNGQLHGEDELFVQNTEEDS